MGLGSVVELGLAFGIVLRLGLVSGLYNWLFIVFHLATVRRFVKVMYKQKYIGMHGWHKKVKTLISIVVQHCKRVTEQS